MKTSVLGYRFAKTSMQEARAEARGKGVASTTRAVVQGSKGFDDGNRYLNASELSRGVSKIVREAKKLDHQRRYESLRCALRGVRALGGFEREPISPPNTFTRVDIAGRGPVENMVTVAALIPESEGKAGAFSLSPNDLTAVYFEERDSRGEVKVYGPFVMNGVGYVGDLDGRAPRVFKDGVSQAPVEKVMAQIFSDSYDAMLSRRLVRGPIDADIAKREIALQLEAPTDEVDFSLKARGADAAKHFLETRFKDSEEYGLMKWVLDTLEASGDYKGAYWYKATHAPRFRSERSSDVLFLVGSEAGRTQSTYGFKLGQI